MDSPIKIVIAIALAVLIAIVVTTISTRKKVTKKFEEEVAHLEDQIADRDTLLEGYKVKMDDCLNGLLTTRDSLSLEIERLLDARNRNRPDYKPPQLPTTTNDELLIRVIEFLENPQ